MKKDVLLMSVIIVGALGYLTAFSMGAPLYEKEKPKVKAGGAPCAEAGAAEEAGGYGGGEAGGYGAAEEAGGYGGGEAGGYGEAAPSAPCPEAGAAEEAGGYGGGEAGGYGESSGYGSELGYL